jgi:hypothetical protein
MVERQDDASFASNSLNHCYHLEAGKTVSHSIDREIEKIRIDLSYRAYLERVRTINVDLTGASNRTGQLFRKRS